MSKRSRSTKKHLRRALQRRTFVRLTRFGRPSSVEGYVVGVGSTWVLVLEVVRANPDGWLVVNRADIKRVRPGSNKRFHREAMKALDAWPPRLPGAAVDLDGDARAVIESLAAQFPLVGIHYEHLGDAYYIGRPRRWGKKKVLWHDANPNGKWASTPLTARLAAITSMDVGGQYISVLARVVGEPLGSPETAKLDPERGGLPVRSATRHPGDDPWTMPN